MLYQLAGKTSFVFAFLIFLCFSCTHKKEKFFIKAPIPELDPKFHQLIFNAEEGLVHTFKNGTEISIPENALIDGDGNTISGKVDLQYRAFEDAAKVYLAGIPMSVQINGEIEHFQTAGSFEINATQDQKPVYLKTDKPACVKMASSVKGKDYDFYYLDQNLSLIHI